ncbi:hypothetical protein VTI28DRAFT_9547 [Corynascus sepedonium]
MATLDDAGVSQRFERDSESPSSSSRSSSAASRNQYLDQRVEAVCRWRTARYHDQECSRYFDCPTHVVERAISDAQESEEEEETEENREEGDVQSEEDQVHPDSGEVSPLSAGDGDGNRHEETRSSSPELPAGTAEADNTTTETHRAEVPRTQQESTGAGSNNEPTSRDMSPSVAQPRPELGTHAASGGPSSPLPSFVSRDTGASGSPTSNPSVTGSLPVRPITRPPPAVSATTPWARSEVVLPRWQPDSEQTYCPICGTQFSIFVRKHHCRKCGRVVCNSCSPHRITIPHRYIVRPPGAPPPLAQGPSLSLLDSQGWYPEFSGGERVRLCNPCVPDPNTAPPQSEAHQQRSQNDPASSSRADSTPSNRWSFYFGAGTANDAHTRTRSVTLQPGPSSSSRSQISSPRGNEARILWGTPPAYYRPTSTSQSTQLYPGTAPRYRSMLDVNDRPGPSTIAGPSSSSAARRFHSVVPPRPPIPEEDECPVCHRELPPRTLPNFETLRESHITSCIASHSRYGGPPPASAGGGDGNPDALPIGAQPPPMPRRTGMFPYTATEKDCVDSAECSICLEEFEVGVPMARLECLCRFHRACINAWWERHPGRCPMHQHDGFGY